MSEEQKKEITKQEMMDQSVELLTLVSTVNIVDVFNKMVFPDNINQAIALSCLFIGKLTPEEKMVVKERYTNNCVRWLGTDEGVKTMIHLAMENGMDTTNPRLTNIQIVRHVIHVIWELVEDMDERQKREKKKEAIKKVSDSNKPHEEGSVSEIAQKYGLSKSEVRRRKRDNIPFDQ